MVAVQIITHWYWFVPGKLLTSQDWWYFYPDAIKQLSSDWNVWFGQENLGGDNPQLYFYPIKALWAGLASIGFSFTAITKLTFLYPIILFGSTSIYFLLQNKIGKWPAFFASLYYSTTTYFVIRQTAHLNIALVYAIAPYLILAIEKFVEKKNLYSALVVALILSIAVMYEIRITILVVIMSLVWILFTQFDELKKFLLWKNLQNLLLGIGVVFLLNIYWIIPSLFARSSISAIAGRGVFGNNWFTLKTALFNFSPEWTGDYPDINFQTQPVPSFYLLLLVPLTFAVYFAFKKKNSNIFGALFIAFIGVLLTKQAAPPFPELYSWLYQHVPGFVLYREASKFSVFTSVGYAILIGYTLFYSATLSKKWRNWVVAFQIAIVGMLALSSILPILKLDLGTMFVNRTPNAEYIDLQQKIVSQRSFSRTLAIPTRTRWIYMDQQHPILSLGDIPSLYQKPEQSLLREASNDTGVTQQEVMKRLIASQSFQYILENLAVNYVVVPQDFGIEDEDVFRYFGAGVEGLEKTRSSFIASLDAVPFLQKVASFQNITVYKNTKYTEAIGYSSLASSANLPEKNVNTAYVKNASDILKVSSQFSPQDLTYNYTLQANANSLSAISHASGKEYSLIAKKLPINSLQTSCELGQSSTGVQISQNNSFLLTTKDTDQCIKFNADPSGQDNIVLLGRANSLTSGTINISSQEFESLTSFEAPGELGKPCNSKKATEYCGAIGTVYSSAQKLAQPITIKITANRSNAKLSSNSFYVLPTTLAIQDLQVWSIDFAATNLKYLALSVTDNQPTVQTVEWSSTASEYNVKASTSTAIISLPVGFTENWKVTTSQGHSQLVAGTLGNTIVSIDNLTCTNDKPCDIKVAIVHASEKYFLYLLLVSSVVLCLIIIYIVYVLFKKRNNI